ncbi:hypothetical protein FBU31_001546 [Coemansia sp. 'formosensis']|nr:hypothetical protein FBU31_001546 [Coemansia sp. 'formosensis']
MTSTSENSDSVEPVHEGVVMPILLREIKEQVWARGEPRVAIVHTIENWDIVERLVNELRYELKNKYHMNVFNIKVTQSESIHEIPQYIARMHPRCQIIYAVGVEFKTSPLYEPRLVDLLTRRIDALSTDLKLPLPVFDCILVRESREQIEQQMQGNCFAASWARRGIDAFNMLVPH